MEVRVRLPDGIARVMFMAGAGRMILQHGFIKRSQKTPADALALAKTRLRLQQYGMKKAHVGANLDDFPSEEVVLADCEAGALRRVATRQIEQETKRRRISRAKLVSRMKTSRTTLDQLFAEDETQVTLQLLERAALALGRKLKVELA